MTRQPNIAVVIPCYRVSSHVLKVIEGIGPEVCAIFAVDDKCPDNSGALIAERCNDPRVRVLTHQANEGVGGATVTGYRAALADGCDIVVKLDGDGQMDPALIPLLVRPIVSGQCDYAKGNRFFDLDDLRSMPAIRLFGNAVLSLVSKMASGYWRVMDPTNGFTAIHRTALSLLPLEKIDRRYFFESDMLFRLYTIRAVVRDVPMASRYGDETSSLRISRVALTFPMRYAVAAFKRVFYTYFLRDFNAGTLQLFFGALISLGGISYGVWRWVLSAETGVPATAGNVMLASLPLIIGAQMLLGALHYDVQNSPTEPLQADEASQRTRYATASDRKTSTLA